MNWMNVFLDRLDELRREKKLSERNFCIELGFYLNTISKYKAGQSHPTVDVLITLSKFFDVTVDYLIGNSDFRQFNTKDEKVMNAKKIREETKAELIDELIEYIHLKDNERSI